MDLYDAVANGEKTLRDALEAYHPENRLLAVMGGYKKSAFWSAMLYYPESLRIILELLPEEDRIKTLKDYNFVGSYNYTYSITNTESFEILLDSLGGKAYLDLLRSFNPKEVFFKIAIHDELLGSLSAHLDDVEFNNFLDSSTSLGTTVLSEAAKHPKSLKVILNHFSDDKRPEFVIKNIETLLAQTIQNDESLAMICDIAPADLLSRFVMKNHYFYLSRALRNVKSLDIILKILPEKEHLNCLRDVDVNNRTILHHEDDINPIALRTILSIYPAGERIKAIMARDNDGKVPFLSYIHKKDCLDVILELIPADDQKALFTHKKPPIYSFDEYNRLIIISGVLPALICDDINEDMLKKFPSLKTYLIIDKHLPININYDNTGYFFKRPLIERASRKLWHDIDKAQNLQGIKDALINFISEDATHATLPELASLIFDLENDTNNSYSQELLSTIRDTVTKYQKQPDYLDSAEYRLC